jgi:chorismate mutase/prephenate dehydratase
MKKLPGLRRRIDALDDRMLALLNERAQVVQQVYVEKLRHAKGGKVAAFVPGREAEILRRLAAKNRGPFPEAGIAPVFREVISACRSLEISPRIAYFGMAGSNTHQAALNAFGSQGDFVSVVGIPGIFEDVSQGRADYGVVPVENSTEGVINHTLDLFVDSDLKVCAEVSLPIRYQLLNRSGKAAPIRRILSHSQSLAQCRRWLARRMPGVELESAASTSAAAQAVAADKSGRSAAIASQLAARLYGLKAVATEIQDQNDNSTRFFVIGRALSKPTGRDKTSVMLGIRDRVGALSSVLKPFESHQVNLTSIESRPSQRKAWEYYFFIDFHGHQAQPRVQRLLKSLQKQVAQLKVLGSYPAA